MCRGVDKLRMRFGGGICSCVTEVLSRQTVSVSGQEKVFMPE